MELPESVAVSLGLRDVARRSPAWIRLDESARVLESGGDLARYALPALDEGDPAERIDALCGVVPLRGGDLCWPLVELAPDRHAELWVFRHEERDWVVFLSPSFDVGDVRARQQRALDVALLAERLERAEVIARDRLLLASWTARSGAAVFAVDGPRARLLEPAPEWIDDVPSGDRTLEGLSERFPVLDHFLAEARALWRESGCGELRSGVFTEELAGEQRYFEATAGHLEGVPAVTIEQRDPDRDERVELLRRSRSLRLSDQTTISRQARAVDSLSVENDELERRVKARTEELEMKNAALRAREERLRSLSLELSRAETRERERIAGALHDGVGQLLATVQIRLGTLAALAAGAPGELASVREIVGEAIQQTRTLTADLGTPILHQLGLDAALESLADRFAIEHKLEVRFQSRGEEPELDRDLRQTLFESARELLFNAVKHSGSRGLLLERSSDAVRTEVLVADEGVGFEPGVKPSPDGGYGLFRVRERLESLGGALEIDASPGAGARLTLRVPHGSTRRVR